MVGLDPEISVKRPADLVTIALDFFDIMSGPVEIWRIVRHAFGRPDADVRTFVPEQELWKMYWSSRIYVAIVVGVGLFSLSIGSFLPMMFVALPRFYGGWLHQLLGLTQHSGLEENIFDHRQNTRTVYINPVFRFLYLNMNYHIEHHSIPMVPFYALPRLHEAIKDQTPTPYPNLWAVYKEMIPTLYKQATQDPDYHIVRKMPELSPEVTASENGNGHHLANAIPSATRWFEVCAVADLDENDVTSFKHDGHHYAVYRLSEDNFYASEGLCTHGKADLSGGLVINGCIECPKHNGRFDVITGKALTAPARIDLKTYHAQRRGNKVFINIPETVTPVAEEPTLQVNGSD